MSALTNDVFILPSTLAAFTVTREHVCIEEEESKEPDRPPRQLYGSESAVNTIASFIGSKSDLGNPSVLGSLSNLLDHFEGKITVVSPEYAMNAQAVTEIARSYSTALRQLKYLENFPTEDSFCLLQRSCISLMTEQVKKNMVFFFHDPTKPLCKLKQERRVTIVGPLGFVERDPRTDLAYNRALIYYHRLEETYRNETVFELFYRWAFKWKVYQIEANLTYLFRDPSPQEFSSLSLSSSSSLSNSDGMAPLNSWK